MKKHLISSFWFVRFCCVIDRCYDSTAAEKGRNDLTTRVLAENDKALFVHCYGDALNLAAQDNIKTLQPMRDLLDNTSEITMPFETKPKRVTLIKTRKDKVCSGSFGVRTLFPERRVI